MRAGRVNTLGRMERGPAYYEVRARVDDTPGVRAVIRLMSPWMGRHVENPGKGGADVQLMRVEPSPRRIYQGIYWNPYVGTRMPVKDLPPEWMETSFGRLPSGPGQETETVEIARPPRASGGRLRSTKRDAAGHGYGMRVMEGIAKKYGGAMKAGCEGGRFTVYAALQLEAV